VKIFSEMANKPALQISREQEEETKEKIIDRV
jgi:hypothetical protein